MVIPLSSIRKIAQGNYPYSAKPLPIHFIEVTFAENGVAHTLLFTPVLGEVMFPREANRLAAEWLSALQEAVQTSTGRSLPVERSQVAQDKFWLAKTFLLTAVQFTVIFSIIPLILHQRLPNRLSELLPGPIAAVLMIVLLATMRWWWRRSAIASGNLDSLTLKAGETDWRRNRRMPAAASRADEPTWRSPDAGWGWLIGKMFGITFTSRLAYRCANLSALGFLGFLGFMPGSGWQGCFGFFGLFGLIGVAHVIEAFIRPNLTVGKMIAMVTAIGMAIAVLVSFLFAYLSVAPLRLQQQWQAATKLVGPGIDRVVIEGHQATIEGEASTESRIIFSIGEGYESFRFKKDGRFTATVKRPYWSDGLDISVMDADGNRLLTSHLNGLGTARLPTDQVVFGKRPLKRQPDGTIAIAEVQRENGGRLPLTVRLSDNLPN
jgi:hypothetical protein